MEALKNTVTDDGAVNRNLLRHVIRNCLSSRGLALEMTE